MGQHERIRRCARGQVVEVIYRNGVLTPRVEEQPSDFPYWQSVPYEARLAALEEIRREYHRWKYGAEPRLQRVCSIVKRQ